MKVAVMVVRILLGLVFIAAGVMKVLPSMQAPIPPGDQGVYMSLLIHHGWFAFYGLVELAAGLMLVAGFFVPLGLTLLAGVGVNILLVNASLSPAMIWMPLILAAMEIFLVWAYRDSFAGIFAAKAKPVLG